MALGISAATILDKVAGALVAQQRYATVEEALWELALWAVHAKLLYYRRRVRRLERKHGMEFEQFTAYLQNRATPSEEDDWLAWRSARAMLADWQKAYQDLLHARPLTAAPRGC